ncbi:MAG: hypothetical protein LCH54_11690 [Bacteroidetes bacterium]|nr:hypothetical protein [Bacteroidota bacterium]
MSTIVELKTKDFFIHFSLIKDEEDGEWKASASCVKLQEGLLMLCFLDSNLADFFIQKFQWQQYNLELRKFSEVESDLKHPEFNYTGFLLFQVERQIEEFFEKRHKMDYSKMLFIKE